jgi:hypothetical protein
MKTPLLSFLFLKKMENKEFYIKYLSNNPVLVETHADSSRKRRDFPLVTVAHLVSAYKDLVKPLLENFSIASLSLHLPESLTRSSLEENCFSTVDENDTSLSSDCPLKALDSIGSTAKQPLIIKSKLDIKSSKILF